MSVVHVRAALETALADMSPPLATANENVAFTPVAGTPYQQVTLILVDPDNAENTPSYRLDGVLQVSLMYPQGDGPGAATARAEMIRSTFRRGTTFSAGGITTMVFKTPTIMTGRNEGDRFHLPVRIPFTAQVNV